MSLARNQDKYRKSFEDSEKQDDDEKYIDLRARSCFPREDGAAHARAHGAKKSMQGMERPLHGSCVPAGK